MPQEQFLADPMLASVDRNLPVLLVLASTYPRWAGDPEPGFVHDLAKRLTGRFRVVAICPHAPGALRKEVLDGVEVIRYRYAPSSWEKLINDGGILPNIRRSPWKIMLLPSFLISMWWALHKGVKNNPDCLVHSHWMVPSGIVSTVTAGRKSVVITAHGSDVFALRGWFWKKVRCWVAGRSSRVTAVGRGLREMLEGELGRACHLLPMGVDLSDLFSVDEKVRRLPGRLLFVGRLVPGKRPDLVLKALAILRKDNPNYELDVVGSGTMHEQLHRLSQSLGLVGAVHFHGRLSPKDVADFYRRSAAVVFASGDEDAKEGLGLVVVEALGCGCPVVLPGSSSIASMLPAGEPTAFVDRMDPAAFADAIRQLVEGRASRQADRSRLKALFDWPAVADRYADLFFEVICERKNK